MLFHLRKTSSEMKTFVLAGFALLLCSGLNAQYSQDYERKEIKTLFDSPRPVHNGGYGMLVMKYGRILDQDAYWFGLRGGWLINHQFTLGIAGHGLTSRVINNEWLPDNPDPNVNARLLTGYGGLLLEPILFHNELFHVAMPITIGAGGATYGIERRNWWTEIEVPNNVGEAYFALEPGLELEINVLRFMRINLGASYLYTSDIRIPEVDPAFMRGFMGSFGLKFGSF